MLHNQAWDKAPRGTQRSSLGQCRDQQHKPIKPRPLSGEVSLQGASVPSRQAPCRGCTAVLNLKDSSGSTASFSVSLDLFLLTQKEPAAAKAKAGPAPKRTQRPCKTGFKEELIVQRAILEEGARKREGAQRGRKRKPEST